MQPVGSLERLEALDPAESSFWDILDTIELISTSLRCGQMETCPHGSAYLKTEAESADLSPGDEIFMLIIDLAWSSSSAKIRITLLMLLQRVDSEIYIRRFHASAHRPLRGMAPGAGKSRSKDYETRTVTVV